MFLDSDEENSDVGRGVLHGDSSLLAMVMSDSSFTESNKVAEEFGKPQLGHSQGHEELSNTERRFTSMLTQAAFYLVLHDSQIMLDMAPLFCRNKLLCNATWKFGGLWSRISLNVST